MEPTSVVGHIPREISRFCDFFLEYGGILKSCVRDTKFRTSPLPQGGREIPTILVIEEGNAGEVVVFSKMERFVEEHYHKPEKIPVVLENDDSEEDDDYLFDF